MMRLKDKWEEDSLQLAKHFSFTKIKSVIYGLAIGDSLGVPVEFRERGSFQIFDMEGYGTYNQPPGTWSDDTSLSLALMEHLGEDSDLNSLLDKFVAYRNGYLTPYGVCFDIGIATNQAIERYLSGIVPEECGGKGEFDNGNGALMRLSPLAILLRHQFDFAHNCRIIEMYTKITHGHPRSIVASILYVQMLIGLLRNNSLTRVLTQGKSYFEEYFQSNVQYWSEYEANFKEIFEKDFFKKDRSEIASTGYVVDTLKACIWCLGTTEDFERAVLEAVNLGGDTDTIGAITGSMAGALYGLKTIPQGWVEKIANKKLIDEKCRQLLNALYR